MSASLIDRSGLSPFRLSIAAVSMSPTGSRFSSESAPWPFQYGIRGRGEQSLQRPYRKTNGRSKRTYELTSSIVPRGTSVHRSVELDFLLSRLILNSSHTAVTSRVHLNSVPSTHEIVFSLNEKWSANGSLRHIDPVYDHTSPTVHTASLRCDHASIR
jgi:hypothetical protein